MSSNGDWLAWLEKLTSHALCRAEELPGLCKILFPGGIGNLKAHQIATHDNFSAEG
jgi:hypothetical protein